MKRGREKTPIHVQSRICGDLTLTLTTKRAQLYRPTQLCRGHFRIDFTPPMDLKSYAHLAIDQDIVLDIFKSPRFIDENGYRVFATHALALSAMNTRATHMYFSIENAQLDEAKEEKNIVANRLRLDLGISYFNERQYKRLQFVPWDRVKDVKASLVGQGISLRRKPREITSSKLYKLLGYYVPEPKSEKAKTYVVGKWVEGDARSRINMRFGSLKESDIIQTYTNRYTGRRFECVGSLSHPDHPDKWSASPDGIVVDIKTGERRVAEFKSSRWSDKFNGYFLPQVYWEMVCAGTTCGDLVKYCELKAVCHVATLQLDTKLYEKIRDLAVKSSVLAKSKDSKGFMSLVHSDPYVALRKELDDIAANLKYESIKVDSIDLNDYIASQNTCATPSDTILESIQKRQSVILVNYNDELIMKQISDYKKLLENK